MEKFLNLDFFNLKAEYIEVIVFVWSVFKCSVIFILSIKLIRWLSDKVFKKITSKIDSNERKSQLLTLKEILLHTLEGIFFVIYIGNLLFLFGIDVRPILATAGVLGVAVGFGAKRFVEDIISGIIILFEGQIRVGDYVEIKDMTGFVEKITLTLITVRSDKSGALYFIRPGYIDSIANYTMNFSYAFFGFDVAYKENIDSVFESLKKAFVKLKSMPEFDKLIEGELEIFGLDEFKDSSVNIKCRIKTQPKGQWTIKRAFNKMVKEQFILDDIEIPFNQLVVTNIN